MAFLKKNLIVIVLMLAVLGGAAYWVATKGNDSGEATVTSTPQGGAQGSGANRAVENAELAQKLAVLANLSISRDIFDDPAFQRLQPNRTEVPRPTFRNQNPFAPIGERVDRYGTSSAPGLTNPVVPGSPGSSGTSAAPTGTTTRAGATTLAR